MPVIKPITDLRNTNEISELCHKQQQPVFITKNGYGDLVVMSMETYEELLSTNQIDKAIFEAEREVAEGAELLDAREALGELQEETLWINNTVKMFHRHIEILIRYTSRHFLLVIMLMLQLHWQKNLKKAILSLEEQPYRGAERKYGFYAFKGYRQLIVENYIIIYEVFENEKVVAVVTVKYGKSEF